MENQEWKQLEFQFDESINPVDAFRDIITNSHVLNWPQPELDEDYLQQIKDALNQPFTKEDFDKLYNVKFDNLVFNCSRAGKPICFNCGGCNSGKDSKS